MSQGTELLNSIMNELTDTEEHIVIDTDRIITIPSSLKRIAVQYDHNIETVTFDCPRYWDGIDMSKMAVYINYMLPDGTLGSYIAENVAADKNNASLMHFTWTISRALTALKGNLTFLVCIKGTDAEGNETTHWNSELNKDLTISEGLECEVVNVEEETDALSQILANLNTVTSDVNTLKEQHNELGEQVFKHETDIAVLMSALTFTGEDAGKFLTVSDIGTIVPVALTDVSEVGA